MWAGIGVRFFFQNLLWAIGVGNVQQEHTPQGKSGIFYMLIQTPTNNI